jgi:DNA-binding GntR family transcriptional regulator
MQLYKQLRKINTLKSTQVYESLKEELIQGQWGFNEKIHVNSLIEKFDVSRRPVMEALKILEKEGFIEIVPQYGCKVIPYSKTAAIEVLRLRSAVETLCVELAVENGTELEMRQFQIFQDIAWEKPNLLKDKIHYLHYNREFHTHIIMMAKSPIVTDYILQIWGLNDFYLVQLFDYFNWDVQQSLMDHQELVDAMKQRNVELSKEILTEHFNTFMKQHLENLPNN